MVRLWCSWLLGLQAGGGVDKRGIPGGEAPAIAHLEDLTVAQLRTCVEAIEEAKQQRLRQVEEKREFEDKAATLIAHLLDCVKQMRSPVRGEKPAERRARVKPWEDRMAFALWNYWPVFWQLAGKHLDEGDAAWLRSVLPLRGVSPLALGRLERLLHAIYEGVSHSPRRVVIVLPLGTKPLKAIADKRGLKLNTLQSRLTRHNKKSSPLPSVGSSPNGLLYREQDLEAAGLLVPPADRGQSRT